MYLIVSIKYFIMLGDIVVIRNVLIYRVYNSVVWFIIVFFIEVN